MICRGAWLNVRCRGKINEQKKKNCKKPANAAQITYAQLLLTIRST